MTTFLFCLWTLFVAYVSFRYGKHVKQIKAKALSQQQVDAYVRDQIERAEIRRKLFTVKDPDFP